mgnify:CR=1 FL=1
MFYAMETPQGEPTPPIVESSEPPAPLYTTNGVLCHVLALAALAGIPFGHILGPLVIWLIKRKEDRFANACGKASLNFQISISIYVAVLLAAMFPLMLIPVLNFILVPACILGVALLFIMYFVCVIIASIKAGDGILYQYPYSIRFFQ